MPHVEAGLVCSFHILESEKEVKNCVHKIKYIINQTIVKLSILSQLP